MDTLNNNFNEFLQKVDDRYQNFVVEIDNLLIQNNFDHEIKNAKTGITVSFVFNNKKRTFATFLFRKTGLKLRIYAENISQYDDFLNTLPDKMKKEIKKASVCKRLVNPNDCNPRCVMGYNFSMDNEQYQKCRYMAFLISISDENNPYIRTFLEKELKFEH